MTKQITTAKRKWEVKKCDTFFLNQNVSKTEKAFIRKEMFVFWKHVSKFNKF